MTMLRNIQKVSFLGNIQGTKHCDISYKNLIYKSMIEYILSADCIYFSPSLVGRVGESPRVLDRVQKKKVVSRRPSSLTLNLIP